MIYLVRHGQTDWNLAKKTQGHTDIPLNDCGKKEAELVAKKFSSISISKIISSDLIRARETAEIINTCTKCPLITDVRLREINYGVLEGIERNKLHPNIWDTFNNEPDKLNAESMTDVYSRIKSFFDELDDQTNILIVTHGGALRMIMHYAEYRNVFQKERYDELFKNAIIKNASVFQWEKSQSAITAFPSQLNIDPLRNVRLFSNER